MGITATKKALNIREELNELKQDTGLKGQELMRADTVAEARTAIGAGRKNLIINGGMQVSQRSSYLTATTLVNTGYNVDRFKGALANITATVQRVANAVLPDNSKVDTVKVIATSAGTGYLGLRQTIEDYKSLSGQVVTISCWYKTNHRYAGIRYDSNYDLDEKFIPDGAWHRFSGTITLPTITSAGSSANQTTFAVMTYNNANVALAIGDYIEFTELQLELCSVATDFEHRSYGEELALCQRYYQKISGRISYATLSAYSTTALYGSIHFPVVMRAEPTDVTGVEANFSLIGNGVSQVPVGINLQIASPFGAEFYVQGTGIIQAGAYWLRGNVNSYITFDAEL